MEINSKKKGKLPLKHYLQYILIGLVTTFISFGSFWILMMLFNLQPNPANIISVVLAVLFAYLANKIVVFKSRCRNFAGLVAELFRFAVARGLSILTEIGGVFLLYSVFHVEALAAKILVSIFVLILNYLFFKFYIFKNPITSDPGPKQGGN